MKKSNYMTIDEYKKLDSFYQRKTVNDILVPGSFGVTMNQDYLTKFPLDVLLKGDFDKVKQYFTAFYITSDGKMIYQSGGYDNIMDFFMVAIRSEDYKDKHLNTIVHVFNRCESFNQTYNLLIDCYRYSDVHKQRVEYSHPFIPRRITKKEIEEILGYPFIIIN